MTAKKYGSSKDKPDNNSTKDHPKVSIIRNERKVHEDIVAHIMGGRSPPTTERYLHAMEQWQHFQGSIVRPPTDIRPPGKRTRGDSNNKGQ